MADDFEQECKAKFDHYCRCYSIVQFHAEKRYYVNKAYEVIDAWLDWRDVQGL